MQEGLERFIEAQDVMYETALKEIKKGQKLGHWIWYIFPQLKGLGRSSMANYYGIKDLQEAKAYLKNDLLKNRLLEISQALLEIEGKTIIEILGVIDAIKVKSSMTLFHLANPNELTFTKVLEKYYEDELDRNTIELLEQHKQSDREFITTSNLFINHQEENKSMRKRIGDKNVL